MGDTELKPAPKLSGPQLEGASEAIVDAFDIKELAQVLRFKWGITLGNYVDLRQGFYGVVWRSNRVDRAARKDARTGRAGLRRKTW
jgi:hypothetical protein